MGFPWLYNEFSPRGFKLNEVLPEVDGYEVRVNGNVVQAHVYRKKNDVAIHFASQQGTLIEYPVYLVLGEDKRVGMYLADQKIAAIRTLILSWSEFTISDEPDVNEWDFKSDTVVTDKFVAFNIKKNVRVEISSH
ncbi:MAG: hypothetical protein KF836_13780 [Fimbriimonadaceae bacterium]|nr:hypothetical protein [Fimbriimonadaceae bacterium]